MRRCGSADESAAFAALASEAFGSALEDSVKGLARAPREHAQLRFQDGRLAAGLLELPMGQWFGGRAVPTLGIGWVAVAAELRGKGHASALLEHCLRDARARGVALSTLYPATYVPYRGVGFELAGGLHRTSVPLESLAALRSEREIVPASAADIPQMEQLYREVARGRSGYLERSEYIWRRIREPESSVKAYVVRGEHGLEGSLYLTQVKDTPASDPDLVVRGGLIATTAAAGLRLLSFLASHRSVHRRAHWQGAASDMRLFLMPDRGFQTELIAHWMLRLVDVRAALLARGYPAMDCQLAFDLVDSTLPENGGTWRLRLTGGVPAVDQGTGQSRVRLSARALGPLYSGFVSAAELARAGLLEADAHELALLDSVFRANTEPALCDYF